MVKTTCRLNIDDGYLVTELSDYLYCLLLHFKQKLVLIVDFNI